MYPPKVKKKTPVISMPINSISNANHKMPNNITGKLPSLISLYNIGEHNTTPSGPLYTTREDQSAWILIFPIPQNGTPKMLLKNWVALFVFLQLIEKQSIVGVMLYNKVWESYQIP